MLEYLLRITSQIPKGESIIRWRIFRRFFDFSREDVVADVGSGHGFWSKKIAPLVKLIVLVDVDRNQIEKAKRENKYSNEFFLVADANCLPFKNQGFNKVLSNQVLEHIADPMSVFREVSRILKRNGVFVASAPSSTFLEKYNFALTKTLQKIVPHTIINKAHHYIVGDFVKSGYDGWMLKVGHVRTGFSPFELKNLGSSSGLVGADHTYLHKRIALIFWELGFCLPLLSFFLRPLNYIAYLLDDKNDCEGLDLIVKYRKPNTDF